MASAGTPPRVPVDTTICSPPFVRPIHWGWGREGGRCRPGNCPGLCIRAIAGRATSIGLFLRCAAVVNSAYRYARNGIVSAEPAGNALEHLVSQSEALLFCELFQLVDGLAGQRLYFAVRGLGSRSSCPVLSLGCRPKLRATQTKSLRLCAEASQSQSSHSLWLPFLPRMPWPSPAAWEVSSLNSPAHLLQRVYTSAHSTRERPVSSLAHRRQPLFMGARKDRLKELEKVGFMSAPS